MKGPIELEDAKTLEELGVVNDDVVAMCFLAEDGSGFEEPDIASPPGGGAEEAEG